jgi:undecaprenyl-diphosphatase
MTLRGGHDVEDPDGSSGTRIQGVEPLALSRQTTAIVVVAAIVLWSSAVLLWMQVEMDRWLLVSHNELRTNGSVVGAAQVASRYGMAVIVSIYLLYLLFALRHEEHRGVYRVSLLVLLMFGIAGIAGDVLKEVFNRPRPFVELAGQINALSSAETPAFPSGHATKSVALALPFLLFVTARDSWRTVVKILLAILAVAVCYSRVLLGAHYVSDVLAGVGMALICIPLVTLVANKILGRMTEQRLDSAVKVWAAVLLGLMIGLVVI